MVEWLNGCMDGWLCFLHTIIQPFSHTVIQSFIVICYALLNRNL